MPSSRATPLRAQRLNKATQRGSYCRNEADALLMERTSSRPQAIGGVQMVSKKERDAYEDGEVWFDHDPHT